MACEVCGRPYSWMLVDDGVNHGVIAMVDAQALGQIGDFLVYRFDSSIADANGLRPGSPIVDDALFIPHREVCNAPLDFVPEAKAGAA